MTHLARFSEPHLVCQQQSAVVPDPELDPLPLERKQELQLVGRYPLQAARNLLLTQNACESRCSARRWLHL